MSTKLEGRSNQLIAKNSVFLVTRSILGLVIGLYTSRVLLAKLGIDDYGVYHVVGSVVIMFGSIRILFLNSIQRFLNYSKGDGCQQKQIFNTGLQVQLMLAGVFVVLAETVGLYAFLQLNLNDSQFLPAHVVYQLSVAAAVVSMLTIPYDALIIANERMNVFAWFAIINQVLNLVIIYLINIGPFSQLVNYAILVFLVSLLLRFISVVYCKRQFEESVVQWKYNRPLMAEMAGFAGWNFLGNTGFFVTHEGINYILNLSGGVVVNAARSISYNVMKSVNALVGNVNMAFMPQTNAAAASIDKNEFYRLLGYNAKTAYVCFLLLIAPLLVFARQVIGLWLGQVPEYVIDFLWAITPYYLLRSLHELINQFFISIGEMKWYQIIEIVTMVFIVPTAYLLLRNGYPFWTVFVCMALFEVANHVGTVWLAVKQYNFPIWYFIKDVYGPFVMMAALSFVMVFAAYYTRLSQTECILSILVGCLCIEGILMAAVAYTVLTGQERKYIINYLERCVKRESP